MDTTPDTLMSAPPYAVDTGNGTLRRSLTMLYRRRWWLIVPAVVVSLAFAAIAYWMPPSYRSEVLLSSGPGVARDIDEPILDVQKQLVGISDVVKRRTLLEQVIKEFKLYPLAGGEVREVDLQSMMGRISVRVQGNKAFLLGFEDSDRRRAAAVVTKLASLVIGEGSAERFHSAEATSSFVESQVETLRTKLSQQEREIEQYKAQHFAELPEYQGANQTVIDTAREQLDRDEDTIAENEARRAAISREMRELEQQGVRAKPADSRLQELKIQLAQLKKRYTDEHPEVQRVRDEIAALEASGSDTSALGAGSGAPLQIRYLQLAAEADAVDQRLRSARAAKIGAQGQIDRASRQSAAAPKHEMTLSVMQREYDSNRAQYDALVKRLHDSNLALNVEKADDGAELRVVEAARVPLQPVAPHRVRILAMGILAGLSLGIACAFLVEQADTTFRDIDEVQRFTGLSVLTAIPSIPPRRRARGEGGPQPNAVMVTDPFGHVAEQYRILATKLRARTAGRRPIVVLVTSPMGGEGKTTTSTNLALALSERADESVVLVDADLRRAGVHRFLGRAHGKGLKELLSDPEADFGPYLRRFDHLHLIQAGGTMTTEVSAAGDLSSEHAQRIFRRLRERFAFIVVDAPPLLAMAESHILQHMADLVLLVVRAGLTPKELVLRALESLDEAPNLNVVLNDTETAATAYGYVYKYYENNYNPSTTAARAE